MNIGDVEQSADDVYRHYGIVAIGPGCEALEYGVHQLVTLAAAQDLATALEAAQARVAVLESNDKAVDSTDKPAQLVDKPAEMQAQLVDTSGNLQGCPAPAGLQWTAPAPPNGKTCFYDHVTAQSPLGEFRIEWKSWKEYDDYCLYLNGDFLAPLYELEDAKKRAAEHLAEMAQKLAPFSTVAAPSVYQQLEDLQGRVARIGLDIEMAVRGHVNEKSPVAGRLKLIAEAVAVKTPAQAACWCTTCRPLTLADSRFVVCPECGNKRCPRAHNHEFACTGSNAPGQAGSSWEHVKPAIPPAACASIGFPDRDAVIRMAQAANAPADACLMLSFLGDFAAKVISTAINTCSSSLPDRDAITRMAKEADAPDLAFQILPFLERFAAKVLENLTADHGNNS